MPRTEGPWLLLLVLRVDSAIHVHRSGCLLVLPTQRSRKRVRHSPMRSALLANHTCSTIRLPGGGYDRSRFPGESGGVVDTIASVPWFIIGLGGIAWEWVASRFESLGTSYRARRGYRHVSADEDAQILRFEDEE